jgi:hypothetical protein
MGLTNTSHLGILRILFVVKGGRAGMGGEGRGWCEEYFVET